MAAGQPFGLQPGHTSSIRRIEGGMLSYQADADITVNPYELGLDRLVDLDAGHDFIGREALLKIRETGVDRTQVGLRLDAEPLTGPNTTFWPVTDAAGKTVGRVTSAVYSPRLEQNIALAFVSTACAGLGTALRVQRPQGDCPAEVVEKPFFDPRKAKAKGDS